MRSTGTLAARLGPLVEALTPADDVLAAQRARQATTEDGRPRIDRGVGFVPDASLPALDTALFGSAEIDIPSIGAGNLETISIPVDGAVPGDCVAVGAPVAIEVGLIWSARVSSDDTVTVRIHNTTASPIDPASGVWKAKVFP